MKNLIFYLLLFSLILSSCNSNSDDDCIKTISIRPEYNFQSQFGTINYPEVTQEVPCDFPELDVVQTIGELPKHKDFSYNILEFNFIPDTGNNTGIIKFKIQINNLSDAVIKGFPYLTVDIGGGATSSSSFNGCKEIQANSSCIIEFDNEFSLNLGQIKTYSIVNVEYLLIE